MTIITWPKELFYAETVDWEPIGGTVQGGATGGGAQQIGSFTGGPFWRLAISGLVLASREQLMAARAIQGALDNGATPIIVGPCETWFSPYAPGSDLSGVPHSDGAPFGDGSLYLGSPIEAAMGGDASRRAATLVLTLSGGAPLIGGEQFSIDHGDEIGRRMYRIIQVTGGTDAAPQVRIRPLLRAGVVTGQTVDFNSPSCVMRLAGEFRLPISHGLSADIDLTFEEWFGAFPS